MTDQNHHQPDELREIQNAARQAVPPTELRDRVIDRLKSDGIIKNHQNHYTNLVWRAAAAILLFGLGFGTNAILHPAFVLLLEEDSSFQHAPTGSESVRVNEYRDWAIGIAQSGHAISGEELSAENLTIVSTNGAVAIESIDPTEPRVGGYFVIRAQSLEQAAQLASSCPHLRYGGRVVIRRVQGS